MPSATRRRRREILTQLEPLGVHVQSLPNLSDLIAGKAQINELCDVDVSDLLGRDPVPPKPKLFDSCIRGQVRPGDGRGRLDRLGAVPADRPPETERVWFCSRCPSSRSINIERELEEVAAHEQLDG